MKKLWIVFLSLFSLINAHDDLINAVRKNDTAMAGRLLAEGANPNAKDAAGIPLLMRAVDNGSCKMVNILLSRGALLGEALPRAFANNSIPLMKELLLWGAKVTGKEYMDKIIETDNVLAAQLLLENNCHILKYDSESSLLKALKNNAPQVAELLVDYYYSPSYAIEKDQSGSTALHYATEKGYHALAKKLIARGANCNEKRLKACVSSYRDEWEGDDGISHPIWRSSTYYEGDGYTPLHIACQQEDTDMITLLFESGADSGLADCIKATGRAEGLLPLNYARSEKVAQLLISLGAHKNDALVRAASFGSQFEQLSQAKMLIVLGADVNYHNAEALHKAAEDGHYEMVELLLSHGANPSAQDENGYTPLAKAIASKNEHVIALLLATDAMITLLFENGAESVLIECIKASGVSVEGLLPLKNARSETIAPLLISLSAHKNDALVRAASLGLFCQAKMLIALGAEVNYRKTKALHKAAESGHYELVELLLSHGANSTTQDENGSTALAKAIASRHQQVTSLLLAKKAIPCGGSLIEAAAQGDLALAQQLLKKGAPVNYRQYVMKRPHGMETHTALSAALIGKHDELAQYLVAQGAELNGLGFSPVSIALKSGLTQAALLMIEMGAQLEDGAKGLHWIADKSLFSDNNTEELLEIAVALIKKGCDVNSRDMIGDTPLHRLAKLRNGWQEPYRSIVRLLIGNGANLDAENFFGKSPRAVAHQEFLALLDELTGA